jgi:hypothetical protein
VWIIFNRLKVAEQGGGRNFGKYIGTHKQKRGVFRAGLGRFAFSMRELRHSRE